MELNIYIRITNKNSNFIMRFNKKTISSNANGEFDIKNIDEKHYEPINRENFEKFKEMHVAAAKGDETKLKKFLKPGAAEKLYKDAGLDNPDEYYNMMKSSLITRIKEDKIDVGKSITELEQKKVPLTIIEPALMSSSNDDVKRIIESVPDWDQFESHTITTVPIEGGQKTRRRRNKSRMNRKCRR
jgi:hypothetical protein